MIPKIRTIKPEFFVHEKMFDVEHDSGLPVRLAFVGLLTQCDREGRFTWRPRTLKAQIMPFDDVNFAAVLNALAAGGFVERYEVEGEVYGVIPTFNRHQVINNREAPGVLPAPPGTRGARVVDVDNTDAMSVNERGDASPLSIRGTEGKGREGKGTEGIGREGNETDRRAGDQVVVDKSAEPIPELSPDERALTRTAAARGVALAIAKRLKPTTGQDVKLTKQLAFIVADGDLAEGAVLSVVEGLVMVKKPPANRGAYLTSSLYREFGEQTMKLLLAKVSIPDDFRIEVSEASL